MTSRALDLGLEALVRAVLAPGILANRWLVPRATPRPDDLPALRRSPVVALKAALDEIFFVSEVLSATVVTSRDGERVAAEIAGALALFRARGWLDAPEHYHRAPPPLTAVACAPARSVGRDYTHVTFESRYEPHPDEPGRERWLDYRPNRTVHAWLLEHPGPPRPWLVCLHGYRTGFPLTDFFQFPPAWLHHRLGLNVLVPVLPLHGPRTIGRRSGEGFARGDILDTVHLQAQAVWDVRRLLGWLAARGAAAVGVYGLSLGGTTAALVAGLEPDLRCVIVGMPAADFVGLARRHMPPRLLAVAQRFGIDWDAAERILRVISPLGLEARVARERRFLFGALADRLVPPEQVHALWHHWERPRVVWHQGSHVSALLDAGVRDLVHEALVTTGMVGLGSR